MAAFWGVAPLKSIVLHGTVSVTKWWKLPPMKMFSLWTHIFNLSHRKVWVFPKGLKGAHVIPWFQYVNCILVINYQHISILPLLIIINRILAFIKNIICWKYREWFHRLIHYLYSFRFGMTPNVSVSMIVEHSSFDEYCFSIMQITLHTLLIDSWRLTPNRIAYRWI